MSESDATQTSGGAPGRARRPGEPARLELLEDLPARPLHEHADVYQELHSDLQAALAEIDSA